MRAATLPISDQDQIAAAIATMAARLAGGARTSAKFPLIKQILREAVAQVPPDTQLPSIRVIAARLNTTVVPAQRAVTELIAEGVLYSRPRAGVYAARRAAPGAAAPAAVPAASAVNAASGAALAPFCGHFAFGSDSAWPYQQAFWHALGTGFRQSYPHTLPVFRCEPDSPRRPLTVDSYERSALSTQWQAHDWHADSLAVRPFLDPGSPQVLVAERLLPLYHRTYFLFFNPDLLARLRLPRPAYHSFAGQTAYLRTLARGLAQQGLEPRPLSVQQPVTLGGDTLTRFLALAAQEAEPAAAEVDTLAAAMDRLLAFCALCRYETSVGRDVDQLEADFRAGRSPCYLGYSVDFWNFTHVPPPFDWAIHPTLCLDDSLFLCPMVGAVSQHAAHPVESLRFLHHLLQPAAQARFAATGNFTAQLSDPPAIPRLSADLAWLPAALARSRPLYLVEREPYYLIINILNNELWRAVLEHTPGAPALRRALLLARSYRRSRSPA